MLLTAPALSAIVWVNEVYFCCTGGDEVVVQHLHGGG